MIISRTPFRLSFFGGGTDYPTWSDVQGGEVLCSTINKFCYITARYLPPFFEHRTRLVYSQTELCSGIDDISHPAIRETLRQLRIDRGVEIHHDGDLPARSGLGSSSAFTVGLLHALYALKGYMPAREQLAREAIWIERDVLQETVGSQDQVAAAYGGLNHVLFHPGGTFDVRPVTIPQPRLALLAQHILLLYTGIRRTASDVARSYVPSLTEKHAHMRKIQGLVPEALALLNGRGSLEPFGALLHEGWEAKRALSDRITNEQIDWWYKRARQFGALGGKIIGAGGGGFLMLFAPPDCHASICQALPELVSVPFRFEPSGSQIIFYDPQEDFSALDRERQQPKRFAPVGGSNEA